MPKYTPATARLKADRLIKLHAQNGMNQTRVAQIEGVTPSAINHRLHKKAVQDTLQEYINSPELKKKLVDVANEGLRATNIKFKADVSGKIRIRTTPDHDARHKYWHDLITAGGILKPEGGGVRIINIVHAYRNKPIEDKKEVDASRD